MTPVRAMTIITVIVLVIVVAGTIALVRSIDVRNNKDASNATNASTATNSSRGSVPVPHELTDATNRSGTLTARTNDALTLRTPMYDDERGVYALTDITVRMTDETRITEDDRRNAAIPVPGQRTTPRTPRAIEAKNLVIGDTLQVFTIDPVLDKTELDATEVRRLLLPTATR